MKTNSRAFVNHVLLGLLVTIGFGGSVGLGTVWMRHQISTTANANRLLAAEYTRIERLIDEKKTIIETEQSPDKLRTLNAAMNLGLVDMTQIQVVHVTENTTDRIAARLYDVRDTDRAPAPIRFTVAHH
jgi:hypothetical protein